MRLSNWILQSASKIPTSLSRLFEVMNSYWKGDGGKWGAGRPGHDSRRGGGIYCTGLISEIFRNLHHLHDWQSQTRKTRIHAGWLIKPYKPWLAPFPWLMQNLENCLPYARWQKLLSKVPHFKTDQASTSFLSGLCLMKTKGESVYEPNTRLGV